MRRAPRLLPACLPAMPPPVVAPRPQRLPCSARHPRRGAVAVPAACPRGGSTCLNDSDNRCRREGPSRKRARPHPPSPHLSPCSDVFEACYARLPRKLPLKFAKPGAERQDSVLSGLQAIQSSAQVRVNAVRRLGAGRRHGGPPAHACPAAPNATAPSSALHPLLAPSPHTHPAPGASPPPSSLQTAGRDSRLCAAAGHRRRHATVPAGRMGGEEPPPASPPASLPACLPARCPGLPAAACLPARCPGLPAAACLPCGAATLPNCAARVVCPACPLLPLPAPSGSFPAHPRLLCCCRSEPPSWVCR